MESIAWFFLEGREALVCYVDVRFLDAMEREYNKLGWPYIGTCVKDNENKVSVTAECICISGNHKMYNWILRRMVEMEPLFSLNRIHFIFSQEMMVQLGVEENCVLRGDTYYLLNKVFTENFGLIYNSFFLFLNTMMMRKDEDSETDFEAAKQLLLPHPRKLFTQVHIHYNPSHYTKWSLLTMEGNF